MPEPGRPGARPAPAPAVDVDLVPDATSDERGPGWGEESAAHPGDADDAYDESILRERPPHHGG